MVGRYFRRVASHPLQPALDELCLHLRDAQLLHGLISRQLAGLTAARRAASGRGGGAPPLEHKTLNRAAILAAVGAWEAFVEDLATCGAEAVASPGMSARKGWFAIRGTGSLVTTPSPANVRKLLWGLFAYDPVDDWEVVVVTNGNEMGSGGTWRGQTHTHTAGEAAKFLAATVNVRHAFAHQDRDKTVASVIGMAQERAAGGSNVGSHHAQNAVGGVLQLSVLTAHGLARHLGLGERFRYKKAMQDSDAVPEPGHSSWQWWLDGTPAHSAITTHWAAVPPP
jgi:hypothetical protein